MTTNPTPDRRARYEAAIREAGDTAYGRHPFYGAITDAVMAVADAEQAGLRRDRDLAIAHDRQPYPTAWAYEQACKALRRKEAAIERVRQMADHWEQQLPEVIRTPAVVSAIRAALEAGDGPSRLAAETAGPEAQAAPNDGPQPPASTALRIRVLGEIIGRIDGRSSGEDSATEEVGAATVRAVLAEILADMQQPTIETAPVALADLYRELAEEAAEWGGVITEHEFRRKAADARAAAPVAVQTEEA